MNSALETVRATTPLPPWACLAALVHAVLLCASLTLLALG